MTIINRIGLWCRITRIWRWWWRVGKRHVGLSESLYNIIHVVVWSQGNW